MGDAQIQAHTIAARDLVFLAFAHDSTAIAGQAIIGRMLGAGDTAADRRRYDPHGDRGIWLAACSRDRPSCCSGR